MATTQRKGKAQQAEEAPSTKRSKGKLLVVLVLVVLLAGGAAAYVLLLRPKPTQRAHRSAPPPGPTYTMPQLTTNLDDGHIVQLTMVLQLAPGDTTTEVSHDLIKLENAAILTFGQLGYSNLLPTTGREQAASSLAAAFNQVLAQGPAPHDKVVDIEFSSFIVQ